MENSYVSDLLRTREGVLGGGLTGYIQCPGRYSFGQWVYARWWRAAKEVISFAVRVSGCSSPRMPRQGTRTGVESEWVDRCPFSFQNKAAGNSLESHFLFGYNLQMQPRERYFLYWQCVTSVCKTQCLSLGDFIKGSYCFTVLVHFLRVAFFFI